ncbi:MAG TPA: ParA family protein [Microvirga sp.]|jgi:chromosome partitioning protein|nr:ParA family protein [Microvirga sp.]
MDVLALVTQKGGTGKSSLAVSLAVAAVERGLKVALLDTDPQGTTASWHQRRQAEAPAVTALSWSYLSSHLHALDRAGTDLAIVDTPGSDSHATTAAIREAHLCLLPVRPSVADIEAARPTIRELGDRAKSFAFVLNQCPVGGRTARTANAVRALQLISPVADTALALRADHMDALACGLGVTEHDPRGKAAAEIRSLLEWVLTRLKRGAARLEAVPPAGMRA